MLQLQYMLIHMYEQKKRNNVFLIEYFRHCLQAIDKDGSGFIDAGELGRMGGKMDTDKAKALMHKLDKDGDGKINLEEFRTLFKQWEACPRGSATWILK